MQLNPIQKINNCGKSNLLQSYPLQVQEKFKKHIGANFVPFTVQNL
jgi:hypothetical protein